MRTDLKTELVLDALDMAIDIRRPSVGLVHHSGSGSQYTSLAFGKRLRESGIVDSAGLVGDAYDNAAAESFVATLKTELLHRYSWPKRLEAKLAIFDYVETFYNRKRRHSTIGQVSPMVYEERYWSRIALSQRSRVHRSGSGPNFAWRRRRILPSRGNSHLETLKPIYWMKSVKTGQLEAEPPASSPWVP
jgi:hypothetical protein